MHQHKTSRYTTKTSAANNTRGDLSTPTPSCLMQADQQDEAFFQLMYVSPIGCRSSCDLALAEVKPDIYEPKKIKWLHYR